jgi:hypothetical protein
MKLRELEILRKKIVASASGIGVLADECRRRLAGG